MSSQEKRREEKSKSSFRQDATCTLTTQGSYNLGNVKLILETTFLSGPTFPSTNVSKRSPNHGSAAQPSFNPSWFETIFSVFVFWIACLAILQLWVDSLIPVGCFPKLLVKLCSQAALESHSFASSHSRCAHTSVSGIWEQHLPGRLRPRTAEWEQSRPIITRREPRQWGKLTGVVLLNPEWGSGKVKVCFLCIQLDPLFLSVAVHRCTASRLPRIPFSTQALTIISITIFTITI